MRPIPLPTCRRLRMPKEEIHHLLPRFRCGWDTMKRCPQCIFSGGTVFSTIPPQLYPTWETSATMELAHSGTDTTAARPRGEQRPGSCLRGEKACGGGWPGGPKGLGRGLRREAPGGGSPHLHPKSRGCCPAHFSAPSLGFFGPGDLASQPGSESSRGSQSSGLSPPRPSENLGADPNPRWPTYFPRPTNEGPAQSMAVPKKIHKIGFFNCFSNECT